MIKKLLRLFVPKEIQKLLFVKKEEFFRYRHIFFSQEGEDIILERLFGGQKEGFYVDIGAHHPFRFSNTYAFYKKGWRGINIEPNSELIRFFDRYRKRDINLCMAIASQPTKMMYFSFKEPALNTLDSETAEKRQREGEELVGKREIDCLPLANILEEYLPKGQTIDFMSIDCEGMDLEVLKSNDWEKYKPKIIVVEIIPPTHIEKVIISPVYRYLVELGYVLFSKLYNSCIFIEKDWLSQRG